MFLTTQFLILHTWIKDSRAEGTCDFSTEENYKGRDKIQEVK